MNLDELRTRTFRGGELTAGPIDLAATSVANSHSNAVQLKKLNELVLSLGS